MQTLSLQSTRSDVRNKIERGRRLGNVLTDGDREHYESIHRRLCCPFRENLDAILLLALPTDDDGKFDEKQERAVREGHQSAVVPFLLLQFPNLRVLNLATVPNSVARWLASNVHSREGLVRKTQTAEMRKQPDPAELYAFKSLEEVVITSTYNQSDSGPAVMFACFFLPTLKRLKAANIGYNPAVQDSGNFPLDLLSDEPAESLEEIRVRGRRLD